MIRAVIFDMFETLITHYESPLCFGAEMAEDAGIPKEQFYPLWRGLDYERTIGKITLEELLERILKENDCYSEEGDVIKESELYPFFDAVYLSYEQGVAKPNKEIFLRCVQELCVKPEECLYIGDGGSRELETARELGMHAMQAVWYLKEGTTQPSKRKAEFGQVELPFEVLGCLEK